MKSKRSAFLIIAAVLNAMCFASAARKLPDANNLVQLEDYLRYAALNNAALKASFEQWKAALEQIPQARALPDPKFTYGYYIREVETRVGPQRQKFDIMQSFPWFGTIEARTDEAAAKAKAAYKRYEARRLWLFYEVKYAFYGYSYLAKAIAITKENLELVTHFEEVARSRYATSVISHPDIIRAQIELAILEDRLKSLEQLRPAITAKLNSILNRPTSSELPWPEEKRYEQVTIEAQQLQNAITQNNPQLQALDYDIEAVRNKEKLAGKKFYPDIGVGVSYIDTTHAMASGVRDSGKDPVIAMVSLTLPIWTDNYKAAERQAKAQLRQTTQEKIQLENTLAARARQALYEFEDSNRKIRLYGDVVIPKTREMVTASESAYLSGTIDFLSLIDAQRALLRYQLDYERVVAENAQKLAELEMLAGAELSRIKPKGEGNSAGK